MADNNYNADMFLINKQFDHEINENIFSLIFRNE
jgi:hypothetical protein